VIKVADVKLNLGSGSGGGCNGDYVLYNGDPNSVQFSGTTLTASGPGTGNTLQFQDPTEDLRKQIEELQAKVEKLEKAENERKNVEYFRNNLKNALKVPPNYLPKQHVGPNDILVVYLDVSNIPPNHIDGYMRRAKKDLASAFDERGLKGRSLWVPIQDAGPTHFGVIGVQRAKGSQSGGRSQPPVMG
jgi:hypothetical protein